MELPPDRQTMMAKDVAMVSAVPLRRVCAASASRDPDPAARLCLIAMRLVAETHGVALADLRATSRGTAAVAQARQCAMYLAHVAFALSFGMVGRAFGRDRTTAAHACRRMEDRRDDPAFDRRLARLERMLTAAALCRGDGQ